jgi:hypothetical protein
MSCRHGKFGGEGLEKSWGKRVEEFLGEKEVKVRGSCIVL